jgi:hypothetical protein
MAIPASVDAGDRSDAVGLPEQPRPLQSHVIGPRGRMATLLSETSNDYSRIGDPVAPTTDTREAVLGAMNTGMNGVHRLPVTWDVRVRANTGSIPTSSG